MKISRKTIIQIGVLAVLLLVLVATGYHQRILRGVHFRLLNAGLITPSEISSEEFVQHSFSPAMADSLKLVDENGRVHSLADLGRDRVVFINKWATWCAPCIAELPGIENLYRSAGDSVEFIMISRDEDFEKARAFKARKEYGFPIYQVAGKEPDYLKSRSIPVTFLIPPDRENLFRYEGMRQYDTPAFGEFLDRLKTE